MARVPRAPRHSVNVFQALALFCAFLLVAGAAGVLSAGLLMPAVAVIGSSSSAAQEYFDDLPTDLEIVAPSEKTQLFYADGTLLATYFAENRDVVALAAISPYLQNAVIATEDQRFREHAGVDPEGLIRATLRTLTGNKEGASTLTQQYVKNVLIEAGRQAGDDEAIEAAKEADGVDGIGRKLREMKVAMALEEKYSKDQILEGYLNIAQFGVGQYGAEAASQYYFGHSAAELTPAEAALIAGVTKSPGRFDPSLGASEGYVTATNRRDTVLFQMLEQGYITQEEHDTAVATPVADMMHITVVPRGCAQAGISAFFCEYVTKALINDGYLNPDPDVARQILNRGGLSITTTIDPVRQQQAYDSLVERIPENDPTYRPKGAEKGVSGAISTVVPGSGDVVAMVQNASYGEPTAENPRATKVNWNVDLAYGGGQGFLTGSTFKAFVLTQWLIDGHSLTDNINGSNGQVFPANSWNISCSPSSVANYPPKNLESSPGGNMTVLKATQLSINTAYVGMANQMDLCALRDTTSRMGVHVGEGTISGTRYPNNPLYVVQDGADILATPSMALGVNPIAPLTMSAAFATYAANGVFCEPRSVTSIVDATGTPIEVPGPQCSQAIPAEIAAGVNYALQSVVSERGATGTSSAIPGRPSAGKTGTANDDTHAWFVGYTPQLSTAVWTGHHEGDISMFNSTIAGKFYRQVYGGALPAPIWGNYMAKATEGMEVIKFPDAQEKQIYGERIQVPSVAGQSIQQATVNLTAAGFTVAVGEGRYSPNVAVGNVGQQSPGGRVTRGSVITIYPSLGPEPVPEITTDPVAPDGGGQPAQPGGQPPQPGGNG